MPNWYGKNPAEPAETEPPDDVLTQALEEHDAEVFTFEHHIELTSRTTSPPGGPMPTRATFALTVEVAQQDEDLIPKVAELVKARFKDSAIHVTDVELVDVRTLGER